jgi:hypothetical protein
MTSQPFGEKVAPYPAQRLLMSPTFPDPAYEVVTNSILSVDLKIKLMGLT